MRGDEAGGPRGPAFTAGLALLLIGLAPAALDPSPRSLSETLAARFPAIRSRLESPMRFAPTNTADRADRVRVSFPSLASDPVVAEGEGVRVVLAPIAARAARPEVEGATVGHRDLYPETDALNVAKPDWTEEYLHLRSPAAPRRFEYQVVETAGARRVFLEDGQVHFLDDAGQGLVILRPVVIDAIGRRSASAAQLGASPLTIGAGACVP